MSSGYVPRGDAEFDSWLSNLYDYAESMTSAPPGGAARWPDIPASAVEGLHGALADWQRHYGPTLHPHTPGQTAAKNDARVRAEKIVRPFVQRFLHWPPVTNEDRVNMGVPNRDAVRTDHVEVGERVELELSVRASREVLVSFRVKGSPGRAKPKNTDGAVIIWAAPDSPPASHAELTRHAMASRTPHALAFDETERGKTVYVSAAWQNERGNLGPWCDMLTAIVP